MLKINSTHIQIESATGAIKPKEKSCQDRDDHQFAQHNFHFLKRYKPPLKLSPPSSPAPDFSRWLNPALESYSVLETWTSSSPLPTVETVLILGSGELRDGDVRDHVRKLSQQAGHPVKVIVVDKSIGGYEHDWTVDCVNAALCTLVGCPHVRRVVFFFP